MDFHISPDRIDAAIIIFTIVSVLFFVSPTSYLSLDQVKEEEREISRSRESHENSPFLHGFEGSFDTSINLVVYYISLQLVAISRNFFKPLRFEIGVTGLMRGREREGGEVFQSIDKGRCGTLNS